ncbi:MAG: TlpA disulfide reductase family protein [Candidatus Marinimicrobia bacterium]|jgi:thiol-disulfide isomerase/thioredoxin|nr:TlpA disulfide reductase family protein [Candidatus Neomarinimicrobiota bacterium]MDP7217638.1 TlpA disulfide reductase family protein [Candidatus Neomarinimicrobiota bacterium]HJL73753.1 TlpA disulfide reductase family protein [Candidatus Neomarinimicrobiota bacterium]|tara:strand:+ start:998 stop:1474 length:477 start_codon:yes stop_codon:yes gene_type:complete
MNRYLLIIFILIIGCEQPDLQHTTAATLQDFYQLEKGQNAVMLNFWATSCEPCVAEFPMIVELAEIYENDLSVFFVSMDWLDEKEKAISFLKKQGVDWTTFIKDEKDNAFINGIHAEWSGALPFTILYGKTSGEVVDFWEGEQPDERFTKAVNAAINS